MVRNDVKVKNSLIAGSAAGMLAKTIVAPIDRIKIIYQVNSSPFSFPKGIKMARKICNQNGFLDLWRGNSASLVRVIPYSAIQFTVHEECKLLFDIRTFEKKQEKPFLCFLAGAIAGLCAITATYPLDVARARLATNHSYKGLIDVFRVSLRENKNFSVYKGFLPAVAAIVPYSGVSFMIYEYFKTRYFAQSKFKKNKASLAIQNVTIGAIVSIIGQSLIYPLDVVRRRLQTDINSYGGATSTFVNIYKREGLHGLYNGLALSWIKGPIGVITSMAIFDTVYWYLNKYH